MAMIHIPDITFHKVMNLVDTENQSKLSDKDLVAKTRERIVEILNKSVGA
jgi:hypothetical protein